jgi:hypothetical protein
LLRGADLKIPFRQSLRITFAGLFASNFLPTTIGGDVVRLAGAIQYKLDAATSTASLVVDRLVGMAGMAMMVPFSLPSLFSYRQASFQGTPMPTALAALPLGKWWRSAWEKLSSLGAKLAKALTLWLKHPKTLLISLLYSWVHRRIYAVVADRRSIQPGVFRDLDSHLGERLWSARDFDDLDFFQLWKGLDEQWVDDRHIVPLVVDAGQLARRVILTGYPLDYRAF